MIRAARPAADSLTRYLADVKQHAMLTVEEEQVLARAYLEGDKRAGHRLVTANLRFVVKVANEHRRYGFAVADLVQEGNLGLLKALQKFDPSKGIRFVSYAVWWIRAYIQNYILRSYSLVKLGTTQAQRKLFFSLAKAKRELDRTSAEHGADSDGEDVEKIAHRLGVKADEVTDMERRLGGRDCSLDQPVGDDGEQSFLDFVAFSGPSQEDGLSTARSGAMMKGGIAKAIASLDPRERFIVENRLMADEPLALNEVGEHFSFSRERARQLELRAKAKLKAKLEPLAVELDWPTDEKTAIAC